MDEEEDADAAGEVHSKSVFSKSGDTDAVSDKDGKEPYNEDASKKTSFFRDDGENEVVVCNRLWQITELCLGAFKEAFPGGTAGGG